MSPANEHDSDVMESILDFVDDDMVEEITSSRQGL